MSDVYADLERDARRHRRRGFWFALLGCVVIFGCGVALGYGYLRLDAGESYTICDTPFCSGIGIDRGTGAVTCREDDGLLELPVAYVRVPFNVRTK